MKPLGICLLGIPRHIDDLFCRFSILPHPLCISLYHMAVFKLCKVRDYVFYLSLSPILSSIHPVIRMYLLNETESGPDAIVWVQKKEHNALD